MNVVQVTPPEGLSLTLGGEKLWLLPERALWWPAQQAVVVADVHLGKDAVFRRQGLAIPKGGAGSDLARLTQLIRRHDAARLLVLGDWLHAAPRAAEDWTPELLAWRDTHADLEFNWVVGNHDRRIETLAVQLHAHCLEEARSLNGLALCHEPPERLDRPSLCGHWHPVLRLQTGARTRQRLPAFWLAGQRLVLPAFGSLTGGHPIQGAPTDRTWVTDGTTLFEWPLNPRSKR